MCLVENSGTYFVMKLVFTKGRKNSEVCRTIFKHWKVNSFWKNMFLFLLLEVSRDRIYWNIWNWITNWKNNWDVETFRNKLEKGMCCKVWIILSSTIGHGDRLIWQNINRTIVLKCTPDLLDIHIMSKCNICKAICNLPKSNKTTNTENTWII